VEDVIPAFEHTRLFNGKLVSGLLHDADGSIGAVLVAAKGAGILVGEVKTDGAEDDLFFHIQQVVGQGLGQFPVAPQDVECHSDRRFLPNSWESGEGLN
jgi:hypothetical protein